ncbi:MAG: hypothetical protein J5787_04785, partial [Alphaproteobacteria bacterium]|nr:hypothetical protein [Alphaproteobacteria bacterium]
MRRKEPFVCRHGFPRAKTLRRPSDAGVCLFRPYNRRRSVKRRSSRQNQDKAGLTLALDENLQLWTAIQTLVSREDHPMNAEAKTNLIKLA